MIRRLTESELARTFPAFLDLQRAVRAAGGECEINVLNSIEVNYADTSSGNGSCPTCGHALVKVSWTDKNDPPMHYVGVACVSCQEVVEYAGSTAQTFDLTDWFKHLFGDEK